MRKVRFFLLVTILALVLGWNLLAGVANCAPIEGTQAMAELTVDDTKPLQLSERPDIKHQGRELFIKGYQAQKDGKLTVAIASYQGAIASNPDIYEAFWNLGLCLEKQKQYPEAKQAFDTALKIDWTNPLIYKHLAFISFQLGKPDEGQAWLKKYLHR
jgi:tetratricopeptide (TPR) repeat protein